VLRNHEEADMSALFDAPIHTGAQNLERVLAAGRPVLLVFETPQCGPCRTLAPALDELARAFAGQALIVRIDDARAGDLAARYRVTRVPTLILWRDGRELARVEGAAPASALYSYLTKARGCDTASAGRRAGRAGRRRRCPHGWAPRASERRRHAGGDGRRGRPGRRL
jgi:thioredoxin-like negative regulator of GroEL